MGQFYQPNNTCRWTVRLKAIKIMKEMVFYFMRVNIKKSKKKNGCLIEGGVLNCRDVWSICDDN